MTNRYCVYRVAIADAGYAYSVAYIFPWGVANSGVSTGFSTYERRRNNITGTLSQPRRPCGPPGIRMRLHRRLPLIRRHVSITGRAGMDLILAVTSAGLAHDAAVVSSSGQHESQLGRRQEMQLVNRAPRRNMIRGSADAKHRYSDVSH